MRLSSRFCVGLVGYQKTGLYIKRSDRLRTDILVRITERKNKHMTLVHVNIIKGTTRTVYTDSLMGSFKAMFIKKPMLVNIGAKVHL